MASTRILILAGGTGGHVFPALAVAEVLRSQGHTVTWMGTRAGLEARVVPAAGFPIDWVDVVGLRGKRWTQRLLAPWRLLRACWQAARILRQRQPHVVLGMGGFVAAPGGLMAWLSGRPLIVHEQNRVPGTTNRLLARLAKRVLQAFPDSFPARTVAQCTGNPLRAALAECVSSVDNADTARPLRVLIVGGSLGAQILNETVPAALAQCGLALDIRQQTGPAQLDATRQRYADFGLAAQVDAFIDDMAAAYAWADLAICRAGAMTVSELAAVGLPAILVPYPHAIDDHQTANARYLADAGAALWLPQSELTPARLAAQVQTLGNAELRQRLRTQARALAQPQAAHTVAAICLEEAQP